MMRDNERRSAAGFPPRLTRDRAKGLTVQMIEMGMRDEHDIHRRQVAQMESRMAEALQHKEPAREVRIDYNVHSADLQKEAGVADECQAKLSIGNE